MTEWVQEKQTEHIQYIPHPLDAVEFIFWWEFGPILEPSSLWTSNCFKKMTYGYWEGKSFFKKSVWEQEAKSYTKFQIMMANLGMNLSAKDKQTHCTG